MLTPFVANTDQDWYDFLSTQMTNGEIDEVNFWQPRAKRPMKRMAPGEPIFFRLKRPLYAIAGHGYFAHFETLTIEMAWRLFGWRNGANSEAAFLRRLSNYRGTDVSDRRALRQKTLGCTILRNVRMWPDNTWLPWDDSRGWKSNIVQGRTEKDINASDLLARLPVGSQQELSELKGEFRLATEDNRTAKSRDVHDRVGQGTFRLRLLSAYRGCAITGECTQPVLDAAHIQPYMGPQSNHVQNGLLLTKEWHTLFDRGYVTVTPDFEVKVSEALSEVWHNGRRYYPYDGKRLARLPEHASLRPSRDALAWHGESCFLG